MKRHWSSALLAGALALTLLAAPAQAIQTADSHGVQTVDSGAWFNEKNFPAALYPTAILYSYGLVNGAGTDQYGNISTGVDQPLTRQEAVTLLVRLLGLEEEAKSGQWDTPFTDLADWAAPYVGCAYAKGMAAGTSATTFSGEAPITTEQFLTLMLRALGYSDASGEFSWQDPYALAEEVGLLCPLFSGKGFLRGDAMFICYEALDARPKGRDTTLLEELTANGAIQKRGVPMLDPSTRLKADYETLPQQLDYLKEEFGVNHVTIDFSDYPSFTAFTDQLWNYCQERNYWAPWPEDIYTFSEKPEELYWELAAKMEGFWALNERFEEENTQNYPILAPTDVKNHAWYQAQADYLADKLPRDLWEQRMELKDVSDTLLRAWSGTDLRLYARSGALNSDDWHIPLEYYTCTALSGEGREGVYMLQAMDELTALYDQLVDEDMTDYQKVKAIYEGVMARTDYNNTVFNKYQGNSDWDAMLSDPEFVLSQTWLGVVKGADVVCGGYSQAVSSLLDLAGIPNFVVTSYSGDMGHAWNKVLLDGNWYNLDATWGDGGNSSQFFLRSDQAFLRDGHEDYGWDGTSEDALLFPARQDYR